MGQSGRGLRGPKEEDGAEDVKRQVDSDDNYQKPIYQLVNVKNGGGKLVDLIKSSAKYSSGSFTLSKSGDLSGTQRQIDSAVDKQIYELVEPLLYNGGRGKPVPMSRIWMSRYGKLNEANTLIGDQDTPDKLLVIGDHDEDNHVVASDSSPATSDCAQRGHNKWQFSASKAQPTKFRWVCWKLEERGFVGETALHICFLLSTPTHMILTRKLLTMFPMLINDIYTCDEYFGESSLHMAIVNENVKIVKLLLDHGANVHERCLGSFFLPMDQKDKTNISIRRLLIERLKSSKGDAKAGGSGAERRAHSIDEELNQNDLQSNQFTTLSTNYDGYAYWGEYPLSFATCLGLADCYKLLLVKGADPNKQDSNGNATLHMAVIADRIDMFDLCYSNGADLNVVNKQNLSPLTLAAKLRRVDMFFHILTIQRQVNWIFCNVGFVQVPLGGVDSIDIEDGSCNDDSVLSIVAFGGSNEHLQMLDGLLRQLLKIKWETSVRGKFYWWLSQFLLFMAIALVAYITRFARLIAERAALKQQQPGLNQSNQIYLTINVYSEYLLICYVIYYLWFIIRSTMPKIGFGSLFKLLSRAPEMYMFTVTCLLILACIPLRLLRYHQAEDFLVAIIMFALPLKFLFFCRASESVGSFVVMIYKIIVNDVLCFVVFLMIFVAGFSQSFKIIFKTHQTSQLANETELAIDKNYFVNFFDGLIAMHMMANNEFTNVFDEFNSTSYPALARVLFCVYMILVSILLINMLIAMLGKTYQDIASQPNENLRQWARALLVVERMWSNKERLRALDRYSHEVTLGGRFYGFTWALTSKDREELDSLRKLNEENKINAFRYARFAHCHS